MHHQVKEECLTDCDYHLNLKNKIVFCFRWDFDWLVVWLTITQTKKFGRFYFTAQSQLFLQGKQHTGFTKGFKPTSTLFNIRCWYVLDMVASVSLAPLCSLIDAVR